MADDRYQLTPDDVSQIRRQNTFFRDLMKLVREWGEILIGIPTRQELLEASVREGLEEGANALRELRAQVKRLEELELLRQIEREDSGEAKRLRVDIQDEHSVEHLQEMLIAVTKNLQRAQLKKARAGGNVDYATEADIEEFTIAKQELEAQLTALRQRQKKRKAGQG